MAVVEAAEVQVAVLVRLRLRRRAIQVTRLRQRGLQIGTRAIVRLERLKQSRQPKARKVPLDGRGYTVAVIDFGFKGAKHANLHGGPSGRQLYVTPVDTDNEDEEHGLGVAGVIGAQGGSNFPKGVAPGLPA